MREKVWKGISLRNIEERAVFFTGSRKYIYAENPNNYLYTNFTILVRELTIEQKREIMYSV